MSTYSGFLTDLNRLIYGDNVSASNIPTATLQKIAHLGERRIYREVRVRQMEKDWTGTVTGNLYALPADFEAPSVVHFGKKPLQPIAENLMLEKLNDQPTGDTAYFCQAGTNLQFSPAVTDGTALQGRYYARLPDLDATTLPTNALFEIADDLFLYAALSKSAPFFQQDARVPLWESEYMRIRDELIENDERAAYAAGRIKVRSSVNIRR